jgi:hypothetical protein
MRVLIEAAGEKSLRSRRYEFAAVRDSLSKGETPLPVRLMMGLCGNPEDEKFEETILHHSIDWMSSGVEKIVLYTDLGLSSAMVELKEWAGHFDPPIPVETRELGIESYQ